VELFVEIKNEESQGKIIEDHWAYELLNDKLDILENLTSSSNENQNFVLSPFF
jgi:hypothetical protein